MAIWAVGLAGCATMGGTNIDDVKGSYQSVRQLVVSNLPGGVRQVSANGREFDSGYFPADKMKFQLDGSRDKERATAHIKILGSSRPYTINVRVYVEERQPNGRYEENGIDDQLTQELVSRIERDLANRREDRSIIDDFRAF